MTYHCKQQQQRQAGLTFEEDSNGNVKPFQAQAQDSLTDDSIQGESNNKHYYHHHGHPARMATSTGHDNDHQRHVAVEKLQQ